MRELCDQRDRENPRHELLVHRRVEPDEQHRQPGERRVEQVIERHLGGVPRTELRPDEVEHHLVRDEDGRQAVAEDQAERDPFAAPRSLLEQRRHAQVLRKAGPKQGLACRHEQEDRQRLHAGPCEPGEHLARQERPVRPRRVEPVGRDRQVVEREQEEQPERHRGEEHHHTPAHVVAAALPEEHHQRREDREHDAKHGDHRRRVVGRAQPLVPLRPRVGNLQELDVRGRLVPVHPDLHAVGGVLRLPSRPLVGEGPIAALRAVFALRLDESELRGIQLESRGEQFLRDRSRGGLVQRGAGSFLRDGVGEGHHLAFRRHVDLDLLLVHRAIPAVRPAPQANLAPLDESAEAVQPQLALEIDLGAVFDLKDRRVTAVGQRRRGRRRMVAQERLRHRLRSAPVHRERQVRFRERPGEVGPGKDAGNHRRHDRHSQNQPLATSEPVHLSSSHSPVLRFGASQVRIFSRARQEREAVQRRVKS